MVLTCALFSSCVNLKTPKRADLVPLEAPMLVGKYPVKTNRTIQITSTKDTLIPTVLWYYFKNSSLTDSLEVAQATHIELRLTDKKHAAATLYNGSIPLKTKINDGRLRKGYFRMKHELSFSGIPPFYWSMSSAKIQFGIGKENQLYIDAADETNGSILIMVAGTPGTTRSLTIPAYKNTK
jgi:hypothetical protein